MESAAGTSGAAGAKRGGVHGRVQLGLAGPKDAAQVSEAVALGNLARATLGFLPEGAYRDAASNGTLLLARDGSGVVGYALYALTQRRVRLTHLCIDPRRRKQGIARALVDWISEHHADYPGILVRCRYDYGLGDMWIALGFTQLSEAPGRSRAGHVIVRWWRDHGHPNLFTRPADGTILRASIDLNVLRDLVGSPRPDATASLALIGDQFTDRIQLVRTAALDAEINGLDGALRRRCINQAAALPSIRTDAAKVADVRQALLARVRLEHRNYPRTSQDETDLRHVAESIANGLTVFITRDSPLIEALRAGAEELGLRILQPGDVVVHVDELVRAEAYRPVALLRTPYRRQLLQAGQEGQLERLVNRQASEKPRAFQRLARDLGAAGDERVGVFAPGGHLAALFVAQVGAGSLVVPLVRVATGPDADTLAGQLLFLLRQRARERGLPVIRIVDPHPSAAVVFAAVSEGFLPHAGGYHGFVMDVADDAATVADRAVAAADTASVPRPVAPLTRLPSMAAAEIERRWWPAKLIDSELPTYLVAIQQPFSRELLGEPQGLFPRETGLGLSREHVYYRSPGVSTPASPGRILWYMSGSTGRGVSPAAVIACSQLDDVVTGTPDELHSRYRHLGVWSIEQVRASARHGQVQALRFANTEIFPRAIGLSRLRELAGTHQEHAVPQAPRKISSALFLSIYGEGRHVS